MTDAVSVGAPTTWGFLAHAGGADEIGATALVLAALWSGWVGWRLLRGGVSGPAGRNPRAGGALLALAAGFLLAAALVPRALWGPDATVGPRPSSTARLAIATPSPGATVEPITEVRIDLAGAAIAPETSTRLRPDEGHIHLVLDGTMLDMTYDGGSVRLPSLPPGSHHLEAEFVAADHAPFSPRVRATTTFVVPASGGSG